MKKVTSYSNVYSYVLVRNHRNERSSRTYETKSIGRTYDALVDGLFCLPKMFLGKNELGPVQMIFEQ